MNREGDSFFIIGYYNTKMFRVNSVLYIIARRLAEVRCFSSIGWFEESRDLKVMCSYTNALLKEIFQILSLIFTKCDVKFHH